MEAISPWLVIQPPKVVSSRVTTLFCFHYAGAGASIFSCWQELLPADTRLVAIQLPGREQRFNEPFIEDINVIVSHISDAILPYLQKPFIFFGHSMGALIAFEVTRTLRRQGHTLPYSLIVSGSNAPHLYPKGVLRHQLPDDEFIEVLRQCKGTPEIILQNKTILELLLPRIRTDGAVSENYTYREEPPLPCRITALFGDQDTLTQPEAVKCWKKETENQFTDFLFEGTHFFLHEQENLVLDCISNEIRTQPQFQLSERNKLQFSNPSGN